MKSESLRRIANFVLTTECRCLGRVFSEYEDGTLACPHELARRLRGELEGVPSCARCGRPYDAHPVNAGTGWPSCADGQRYVTENMLWAERAQASLACKHPLLDPEAFRTPGAQAAAKYAQGWDRIWGAKG